MLAKVDGMPKHALIPLLCNLASLINVITNLDHLEFLKIEAGEETQVCISMILDNKFKSIETLKELYLEAWSFRRLSKRQINMLANFNELKKLNVATKDVEWFYRQIIDNCSNEMICKILDICRTPEVHFVRDLSLEILLVRKIRDNIY